MAALSLDVLLYVPHSGDDTDDMTTNLHILSNALMCNILYSNAYASTHYYRNSEGFRELCQEIQDNVPKDVFVEANNHMVLDKDHPRITTYKCYRHCLEYMLKMLGF
jgi:hypothetical protein